MASALAPSSRPARRVAPVVPGTYTRENPMAVTVPTSMQRLPPVAGKYTPIFELGRGGMGDVILAVIQGPGGFNKLQVVKQLRLELAENPEFLSMFLDEARLSARINHANVVQTNEVGFDGRHYFIAMEFLEGQSLESFFNRSAERGQLSIPIFLRILADTCAGLHHAHELLGFDGKPLNVVHRDVSPQNIFITYDGQTKVLDFGIAKAADSSSETRTGIIKGKVAYMAPEQFRSAGGVDRRADVFAMGAILWRVMTGKRLWKGLTDVEVYQQLAMETIPSPTTMNPDAPPALVEICMKALHPKPAERYQTAAALQTALEDFLDSYPQKANQRVIGKEVTELFADRREEVKQAIEARLANGLPQSTGELPHLGGAEGSAQLDASAVAPPSLGATLVAGAAGRTQAPSGVTEVMEPKKSSAPLVFGVILAAALAAIAVMVVRARRPVVAPTPVVAGEVAPATPAAQETTLLTVTVRPADARVFVDDKPMLGPSANFPRDGAQHQLRVEAPGYEPYSHWVTFGSPSLSLSLALEQKEEPKAAGRAPAAVGPGPRRPAGGGGQSASAAAAPAPTPEPAPAPTPAPAATPSRGDGLDMTDPWGTKPKR